MDPSTLEQKGERRGRFIICAALVLLFLLPSPVLTRHDIPADITIQAFVKPEGDRLHVLMRLPLQAMQETVWPVVDPGYLIISEAEPILEEAAMQWLGLPMQFFENDVDLGPPEITVARIELPSDPSFREYDDAVANILSPSLTTEALHYSNAIFDVLFEYPISSVDSDFSIHPRFERLALRPNTVMRFLPAGGVERAYQFRGNPGHVRLDPRWHQAAFSFVKSGFQHILDGIDHLLFLLCLVIPFRRVRTLLPIVTAFTVAHSITLISSAMGFAPDAIWFPALVETLIAVSIVWMALENIIGTTIRRRWIFAFAFGLVHGFGFSFALRESLQFAGGHLLTSLLSFNVGVELGQLAVLVVMVPALEALFRFGLKERLGTVLLSAVVAHAAWHWMSTRGGELFQYTLPVPVMQGPTLSRILLWACALILLARFAWWANNRRRTAPTFEQ